MRVFSTLFESSGAPAKSLEFFPKIAFRDILLFDSCLIITSESSDESLSHSLAVIDLGPPADEPEPLSVVPGTQPGATGRRFNQAEVASISGCPICRERIERRTRVHTYKRQ